jgi:hypothetical protein
MDMKVSVTCHSECSEESAFALPLQKSRFFVALLLRMTGPGDFRLSGAKDLLFFAPREEHRD